MDKEKVRIDLKQLRSPLIHAAMCLCTLAALLALPGVCMLFTPEYRAFLQQDFLVGGIMSMEAIRTYMLMQDALLLMSPVLTAMMAVCLGMCLFGKRVRGMSILATIAEWMVRMLNVVGILVIGLFGIRFLIYTVQCLMQDGGAYTLYAMVIMEGLMVVLVTLGFFQLRKFVDCLCDSATSLAYTLATGNLSSTSIPGFTATGFLLLGIVCVIIASDQLLTLTPVYDPYNPHYELLVSPHPIQWATVGSFLCAAIANVLLFFYLKYFKRLHERFLHLHRKERMEEAL